MRRDPRDVLMWNYGSICCWRRTQNQFRRSGLQFYFFLFPPFLFCVVVVVVAGAELGRREAFTARECGGKFNLTCLDCSHTVYTRAHQTPDTELFNYTCAFSVSIWIPLAGADSASAKLIIISSHFVSMARFGQMNSSHGGSAPIDWATEHTARHCTAIPCLSIKLDLKNLVCRRRTSLRCAALLWWHLSESKWNWSRRKLNHTLPLILHNLQSRSIWTRTEHNEWTLYQKRRLETTNGPLNEPNLYVAQQMISIKFHRLRLSPRISRPYLEAHKF